MCCVGMYTVVSYLEMWSMLRTIRPDPLCYVIGAIATTVGVLLPLLVLGFAVVANVM